MERGIVAKNVRRIIDQRGFKQKAIAEKSGIPPKSFSAMVTGRQAFPVLKIPSIARALYVTPNDLYDEDTTSPA